MTRARKGPTRWPRDGPARSVRYLERSLQGAAKAPTVAVTSRRLEPTRRRESSEHCHSVYGPRSNGAYCHVLRRLLSPAGAVRDSASATVLRSNLENDEMRTRMLSVL